MNTHHVIGLMSGTSLDGVDIAYCSFTYKYNSWIYKLLNAATIAYSAVWQKHLNELLTAPAAAFIRTHHDYGYYLGQLVKDFIQKNNLKPDFVASHGHTTFHQPKEHLTFQVGDGAYIAAAAGLPVVCDFRTMDVALGGQGAPLVPVGDKLLFAAYDFCVNLGGIANLSCDYHSNRIAFDSCACNMLLNALVEPLGLAYDKDGQLARQGQLNQALLHQLNTADYFSAVFPKSLGKEWVEINSLRHLLAADIPVADKLHTACHHIAIQLANAMKQLAAGEKQQVLLTGGGAFNTFLVELIRQYAGNNFRIVVPAPEIVNFKEALIFAFLGVLRWRQEPNCLSSVTGASKDNVGGAIYWG